MTIIERGRPSRGKNLVGMIFGRLKVEKYIGYDKDARNSVWECKCKCGDVRNYITAKLTRTRGAKTCKSCLVIDGKNDIPTFAPWMEKYFKDKKDVYRYTYGSGQKIQVVCPDCGRGKSITVKDLYRNKSIGCVCGDGKSYPEKFVFSILEQIGVDFIYQFAPKWANGRIYDFYLPGMGTIIEVDGGIGHGHEPFDRSKTREELLQIDIDKNNAAKNNGICVVRLNCEPSTYEQLTTEVENKLSFLILNKYIDFNKCDEYGLCNLIKTICNTKRDNPLLTTKDLVKMYKITDVTIRTYLKKGARLGWCNYDPKEESDRQIERAGHKIIVFKSNKYYGTFDSCAEFARTIEKDFGIRVNARSAANSIKQFGKYKEFYVKYV